MGKIDLTGRRASGQLTPPATTRALASAAGAGPREPGRTPGTARASCPAHAGEEQPLSVMSEAGRMWGVPCSPHWESASDPHLIAGSPSYGPREAGLRWRERTGRGDVRGNGRHVSAGESKGVRGHAHAGAADANALPQRGRVMFL